MKQVENQRNQPWTNHLKMPMFGRKEHQTHDLSQSLRSQESGEWRRAHNLRQNRRAVNRTSSIQHEAMARPPCKHFQKQQAMWILWMCIRASEDLESGRGPKRFHQTSKDTLSCRPYQTIRFARKNNSKSNAVVSNPTRKYRESLHKQIGAKQT